MLLLRSDSAPIHYWPRHAAAWKRNRLYSNPGTPDTKPPLYHLCYLALIYRISKTSGFRMFPVFGYPVFGSLLYLIACITDFGSEFWSLLQVERLQGLIARPGFLQVQFEIVKSFKVLITIITVLKFIIILWKK